MVFPSADFPTVKVCSSFITDSALAVDSSLFRSSFVKGFLPDNLIRSTNMDFIKIETSSLDAEELRFNPSTGWVMVGMVDAGGNMFGCSENSSGFGHSDSHGLNSQV